VEAYDAGDIPGALSHFERAYVLSRNYQVLFNIAQLHYELNRLARARAALERYLAEGGDLIDEERRERVRRQLAELAHDTGLLVLHLDGARLQLEVQGRHVVTAVEVLPVVVDAGLIRVVAQRTGWAPVIQRIRVDGDQTQHLEIDFETPVAPSSASAQSGLSARTWVWASAGVLAAGAVSTGIARVLTADRYDELLRAQAETSPERYRARLDRQRGLVATLTVTTDVLGIAALAAAATGVVLSLSDSEARPVELALTPGQLSLRGGF
jgi:hypothetical protein